MSADPTASPSGWDAGHRLSDEDLAKKREHAYVTGLPLANYDPNTGFGAGARAYWYQNGERSHPLFAFVPYQHRVFLQGFASTGGLQFHWLDYDAPYVADTSYRLRAQLIFERNTSRNYFGIGERSLAPLTFPGAGRAFSRFSDYESAASRVAPDGTTRSQYDKHFFQRPFFLFGVERVFGGVLRPYAGAYFTYATVRDYAGAEVRATTETGADVRAPSAPTRLTEDCASARIVGCRGGLDDGLRLAVSYDTRDFEPDPNRGVFVDLVLDVGTAALGGAYAYQRGMLAARAYVSPFPDALDLVLAVRGVYLVQSQGTPFFTMDVFPFTEDSRIGLGGLRTLRGYKQDRFVGHVMALSNVELRWTFHDVRVGSERFALGVVPFVDLGRPFDAVGRTTLSGWKRGQGAGLRVAWNLATVIMVDYGVSTEDTGLYINFNHMF